MLVAISKQRKSWRGHRAVSGCLGRKAPGGEGRGPRSGVDVWLTTWAPKGQTTPGRIREECVTEASRRAVRAPEWVGVPLQTSARPLGSICLLPRSKKPRLTAPTAGEVQYKQPFLARGIFGRVPATTLRCEVPQMLHSITGMAYTLHILPCFCTSLLWWNPFSAGMLAKEVVT